MPTSRSVDNIKAKLLHPALTSHFEVEIFPPTGLTNGYLTENNVNFGRDQEKLNLLCSEASLPGSNLATFEINNDYTGVTERHVYRRIYDDRIDLTFYVDADNYLPIRFFETWIKYAVGENVNGPKKGENLPAGSVSPNYFYRVRYPNLYISQDGLTITKFERTNTTNRSGTYTPTSTLQYKFVNCFPISITSMPVSYDSSSLLKCTVSMSYIRYYITGTVDQTKPDQATTNSGLTPAQQAQFNYDSTFENQFSFGQIAGLDGLSGSGALSTGGVSQAAAKASGNTVPVSQTVNELRSLQEASRLRQAGFNVTAGLSGRQGPGF